MNGLPAVGAHLVTPRSFYTHHGIHVGEGRVVHYAGLCDGMHGGPVREVSLAEFCCGRGYRIKTERRQRFSGEEVARRARSRIGEDRYHLLRNNCEHFCEWCVAGRRWSAQVETWLAYPFDSLLGLIRALARRWRGPDRPSVDCYVN